MMILSDVLEFVLTSHSLRYSILYSFNTSFSRLYVVLLKRKIGHSLRMWAFYKCQPERIQAQLWSIRLTVISSCSRRPWSISALYLALVGSRGGVVVKSQALLQPFRGKIKVRYVLHKPWAQFEQGAPFELILGYICIRSSLYWYQVTSYSKPTNCRPEGKQHAVKMDWVIGVGLGDKANIINQNRLALEYF